MPVTTLDPRTALIIIDLQKGIESTARFNSVTRTFPRLGETGTTQEFIRLLEMTRTP